MRLIDVLWIEQSSQKVAAAFEVEHTASIYSGIVRLLDLALGGGEELGQGFRTKGDRSIRCRTQTPSGDFKSLAQQPDCPGCSGRP